MAKRRFRTIILLLCLCVCLQPCGVLADATTDAKTQINIEKNCSITIYYGYDGTAFPNQTVKLYQVADVSADFQYTLAASFADCGLALNGVQTQAEWRAIRETLEANILADQITPSATAVTDETGNAYFPSLKPGLYLASAVQVVEDDVSYAFDAALVALPGLDAEGLWQYSVTAAAKPEVSPLFPEEEIQLEALKLWRGDESRTDRPRSIELEIFRDESSYATVTLSEENNWSYRWTAKADGAKWKVVERNIPAGYTMTVEQRDTTFVITNTRPDQPDPPPPQTGDTSNILLYIIMMYISGAMLVILGIAGKRKRHEETN